MGKIQNGGKVHTKREMVSASANLEVISQESFVERLQGMSSACLSCQRERHRSLQRYPSRKGKAYRRKQNSSKFRTPVEICLKDTIGSAGKMRESSLDGDSDISTKSTDEGQYTIIHDDASIKNSSYSGRGVAGHQRKSNFMFTSVYGDVASIPEFVPQYTSHYFHPAWPHTLAQHASGMYSITSDHRSPSYFYSSAQRSKRTSQKNFTGLISILEKAHRKELADIEPNLSREYSDAKLSSHLNNESVPPQSNTEFKRKNMAECQNVELICNDLSSSCGKLIESSDESDISDKASVVSSSDTVSDDVIDLPVADEIKGQEFTPEELEQLAEYTTGVPLIRYDYSTTTSLCTDCVGEYYNYQYIPLEATCRSYNCYNARPRPNQQPLSVRRFEQLLKAESSPRSSTSSESDLLSDVEDSSIASSSSSYSSSSSLSSSKKIRTNLGSDLSKTPTGTHEASSINPEICSKKLKSIKRVTVSCKSANNLGDLCGQNPNEDTNFTDSVYLDLTGMDVSISVMCPTESPIWSYPMHSVYRAFHWPTTTALSTGISFPLMFNNQMIYPFGSDAVPSHGFRKYELASNQSRPWIPISDVNNNYPAAVFSVMCYNVLCDKLCTKTMYAYCPTWALSWDYRKKGIMSDILKCSADIITLQEVETEQYFTMFLPELAKYGYDGIFLPKSRMRTMRSDIEKKSVDGCAIFFRKSKFEKVFEYYIEFSQLATRRGASNTDIDMINRVSTKDNIAIVAVLRTRPGAYENSPKAPPKGLSQMLMVSTAHIHWDPQSPDVKLVQTMMLIEELQRCVKEATLKFRPKSLPAMQESDMCNSIPLILCGDFNSLPDSGVFEYLSKGKLDAKHKDFDGQDYQVFMKDRNYNGNITHNFQLTSAYNDVIPFTNYTFDFKGIIDYIFYSNRSLHLHGILGLQDEEWFRANKIVGCPHPFVPSDHFPLFAQFSLPVLPYRPR